MQNWQELVFWKEAVIPEKGGLFYRVYLEQYRERDEAVQFWEKLNEEGAVSYFGVHEFREEIPKKPTEIVEPVPEKPEADVAGVWEVVVTNSVFVRYCCYRLRSLLRGGGFRSVTVW